MGVDEPERARGATGVLFVQVKIILGTRGPSVEKCVRLYTAVSEAMEISEVVGSQLRVGRRRDATLALANITAALLVTRLAVRYVVTANRAL